MELKDYAGASKILLKADDPSKHDSHEWQDAFYDLLNKKQYEQALIFVNAAIELRPDDSEYLNDKTDVLCRLKKYDEAIELYDMALKLKPDNSYFWNSKGLVLYDAGRYDEAISAFEKSLSLVAKAQTSYNLAKCYAKKGDKQNTLKYLKRPLSQLEKPVFRSKSGSPLLMLSPEWHNAGYIEIIKKDDVFKSLLTAEELDKLTSFPREYESALRYYRDGGSLSYERKYIEASKAYDKATEIYPGFSKAWLSKASDYEDLGKYDEVAKAYGRAAIISPEDDYIWSRTGMAWEKAKQYDKALEVYKKAIEVRADDNVAWIGLGGILCNMGRVDEAIKALDKAIELNPDYPNAWYNRACAYAKRGDKKNALSDLSKSITINSNYGYLFIEKAKKDESFQLLWDDEDFNKVIRREPRIYWRDKGVTLRDSGKYEEALKAFDKLSELAPDDDLGWREKAITLHKMGRYTEALNMYDKILEGSRYKIEELWYGKARSYSCLLNKDDALKELFKLVKKGYGYKRLARRETDFQWLWNNKEFKNIVEPATAEEWYYYGVELFDLSKYDEAVKAFDNVLKSAPENYHYLWWKKGDALIKLGRYDEAIKMYDKSMEPVPGSIYDSNYAEYGKAQVYSLLKDKANALKNLDDATHSRKEYKIEAKYDDDFQWLWEDEEFKKLTD